MLLGVLGIPDARAATAGIAALLAPAGRATFLVSVAARDGLPSLDRLDDRALERLARAHAELGLRLVDARPATRDEVLASRSSWARRLGAGTDARPAWRIELAGPTRGVGGR